MEVHAQGGRYTLPLHEFIRAIIFGENDYYDPQSSAIPNLFDIGTDDGREHFLLATILALTQVLGERAGGDGFIPLEETYSYAQSIGFDHNQIGAHLERAFANRLLESSSTTGIGGPCRITTVGSYMHKKLISNFTYVDAMVVDTPIVDTKARAQIADARSVGDRLRRCEAFRQYLDDQWKNMATEPLVFDWAAVSIGLRDYMKRVAVKAGVELYKET